MVMMTATTAVGKATAATAFCVLDAIAGTAAAVAVAAGCDVRLFPSLAESRRMKLHCLLHHRHQSLPKGCC
jgi:hypothetical protein